MGMVAGVCTLSDDNVRKVIADPPLVWKVLAPDDPDAYAEARGTAPPPSAAVAPGPGWLARLFGAKAPPPAVAAPAAEDAAAAGFRLGDREVVDVYLDKAWHGIHYLLTRSAWEGEAPLNFLVAGGTALDEMDVGVGPPRLFTAAQAQAIAAALETIDEAALRARFDPAAMMRLDIYPPIWDRDPVEDDALGYCLAYFAELKAFVAAAAARRMGLVVSLS